MWISRIIIINYNGFLEGILNLVFQILIQSLTIRDQDETFMGSRLFHIYYSAFLHICLKHLVLADVGDGILGWMALGSDPVWQFLCC